MIHSKIVIIFEILWKKSGGFFSPYLTLADEATASLDVESETVVQEAISRLVRNKTVLIIAHRMRTVTGADQVVVLENGTVAERGTPKRLLKRNGIFARMAQLQSESQEWTLAQ